MNKTLERFFEHPGTRKAAAKRQAAAEALLEPGERIQASFYAVTLPLWAVPSIWVGAMITLQLSRHLGADAPLTALLTFIPVLAVLPGVFAVGRYLRRIVIVTNRRILVCGEGRGSALDSVLREVDRNTRLSPQQGAWGRFDQLGDYLWVSKRHRQDLADADAALAASPVARSVA